MPNEQPINLLLQVELDSGDEGELDQLTRRLLTELREQELESADLVTAGPAAAGTKSGEIITFGAIALAVLPSL